MPLISYISIPEFKDNQLMYIKINLNNNEISIKSNEQAKSIININKYVKDIYHHSNLKSESGSNSDIDDENYDINSEIIDMLTKELANSKNSEDILEIENTLKIIKAKHNCNG